MNLTSPTDPNLRALLNWPSSTFPEEYGADALFTSKEGLVYAWQRKRFDDLIASVDDGRLAIEIPLLQLADYPFLILEGWGPWTTEGHWVDDRSKTQRWTCKALRSILRALQAEYGIAVERSESIKETAQVILEGATFEPKGSLLNRPGAKLKSSWGTKKRREQQHIHLLMGFEGLGYKRAKQIVDKCGGAPLAWTWKEFEEIPGFGEKIAQRLRNSLDDTRSG